MTVSLTADTTLTCYTAGKIYLQMMLTGKFTLPVFNVNRMVTAGDTDLIT